MRCIRGERREGEIGQSEQASKINVEGGKIQNNKAGGHNCNKRSKAGRVAEGSCRIRFFSSLDNA